jgi:REP element-mobilizing transposase RayT
MSHTHASVLVHCVFSTKQRANLIRNPEALWRYLAVVARDKKIALLAAGGTANHVHLLLAVPPVLPLATALRELKAHSSRVDARTRAAVRVAGRVWRVQRGPIAAADGDGLHRNPGGAPRQVEFRAGVHDPAAQIGCRVRSAVCVWMSPCRGWEVLLQPTQRCALGYPEPPFGLYGVLHPPLDSGTLELQLARYTAARLLVPSASSTSTAHE